MKRMNLRDKIKSNLNSFKEKASDVKNKFNEKAKEKLDKPLGIFIHREIAAMFFWDDKVTEYVQEIVDLTREGKKEEAVRVSEEELRPYIHMKLNRDRKYQSKMEEINEKLEDKSDELKEKAENLKGSPLKLLNWVRKRNKELEENGR